MSIPGGNLLSMASRVIAQQSFQYFPWVSRSLGGNGLWSAKYAAAGQPIMGSAQPIPRNLYAANGLDFQRLYYNFFVQQSVFDIMRDVSGDQFVFEGKNFQVISKTPWHGIDGWDQVLCIHVPNY